ncbi:MAG: M23 family metallopeptidase [Clostridia bacterium]|nr:M23 family metallopeptidase [Clostridia bacterium]
MKKKIIKVMSIALALISVFTASTIGMVASAANNTTNYKSYNAPEDSGDYAYWSGSAVVKSGSTTKDEIRWMQAALNNCIANEGLKTSYLDVDGSFGPASKTATTAFQKAAGLTADGSFGPATIKKMKSVLGDNKKNSLVASSAKTAKYNLCWPVSSSVSGYKNVTSSLGNRNDPISGEKAQHKGIDIGIPTGSAVLATYGGVVKFVSNNTNTARGKYVVIYHDDIDLTSVYQHLSSYSVKVGQTVSKGQVIAKSGNTGKSTGPHLHFELVVSTKAPASVDCAWKSGAVLIDGHYDSNLINYTYSK